MLGTHFGIVYKMYVSLQAHAGTDSGWIAYEMLRMLTILNDWFSKSLYVYTDGFSVFTLCVI